MMGIRIQIIVALVTMIAIIVIVDMIRKKRLELKYALAWLAAGVGILILDCFPGFITWLSKVIGIYNPVNMLFFLGFTFLLVVIFTLTVVVSRMSNRIKNLTQELALQQKEREPDRGAEG